MELGKDLGLGLSYESDYYQDLLLYLAGALVFLLLLEWYLQHKESSI